MTDETTTNAAKSPAICEGGWHVPSHNVIRDLEEAWPRLQPHVREAITTLIESAIKSNLQTHTDS